MPYNTIQEASDYFSERFGYDLWEPLTEEVQTSLLLTANQYLDSLCNWYGEPVAEDQENAFPRTPNANPTPPEIKVSELEIAYQMLSKGSGIAGGGIDSGSDPLAELKAGSVTLKFDTKEDAAKDCQAGCGNDFVTPLVKRYLSPYGYCNFGTTKTIPVYRG